MSEDLSDLTGEEPKPKSRPMGAASRALLDRASRYPVSHFNRKNTPERLKMLLVAFARMPVAGDACRIAGIDYSTLRVWLQKSSEGGPGDGFDVPVDNVEEGDEPTVRFHIAWKNAETFGVDRLESAMWRKAEGQLEPQVFQGRVIYKVDQDLVDLGATGQAAYLRDKNGMPIPETVTKQDPDLIQFIMKARKPDVYGNKQQIDITHRGGVLVVGVQAKTSEELTTLENDYRQNGLPPIIFDEDEGAS